MPEPSGLPRRVMIDGQNLMLPHGTGIATYSRQVAGFLAGRGIALDVLLDSSFTPDRTDAAENRRRFTVGEGRGEGGLLSPRWALHVNGLLARPRGSVAGPLWREPVDLDGSPLARVALANRAFAVNMLHDAARQHAIRWGRLMPVRLAPGERPDLLHAMQILPIMIPGRPMIATVHDIIPLLLDGAMVGNMRHYRITVETILRRADHVITVSEHSRQDLIRHLGGDGRRITNTYQSVSIPQELIARSEREMADDLAHYGLERGTYFMFLGAIEPKKNVKRLVEAFAGSRSSRTLALVGGLGWHYEDDLKAVEDDRFIRFRPMGDYLQQERQVRRLPYVPREQLVSLVRGARALLFPSLYEGFGLPVAEALLLGTPVMTSTTSSLPEIAGDAALLIDPTDPIAMARAIRQLDQDDDLCAELSRRGPVQAAKFAPEKHEERLGAVYRQVVG